MVDKIWNLEMAVMFDRDLLDCDHVLVAVSGGPDSMALLDVLTSAGSAQSLRVTAAHFDHHLRDDSHRDRELVESFCSERGIDCYVGEADVAAWAEEHGRSLEAAARELRYAFLEMTADTVGAEKILTAHTEDDNVETVLMRIMRGSGVRGLAGIPRERGRIMRPMLGVPRSETLRRCRASGVPHVEDPSNRDTTFERNYIRHEVLPSLRIGFPDADRRLTELATEATSALAAIRRITDGRLNAHLRQEGPGVWSMAVAAIAELDSAQRHVLIADALYHRIGVQREYGRDHYEAIYEVARGKMLSWSLPRATVRREHGFVVFYHGVDPTRRSELVARELHVPGQTRLFASVLRARVLPRACDAFEWGSCTGGGLESGGELTGAVAYFARERLAPPLVVRSPAPGDRVRPFGMGGHRKKLSDLFIDRKIPYRLRLTVPVVEDRNGIVWVAGVTTSETTRITGDTDNVVELRIDPE